jgi:hypothetical protein
MYEGLYERIERIVAALMRFSADDLALRLSDDLPARVSAFAGSDAFLSGVPFAQAAAAAVSALFVSVLIFAVLKKRGLAAAAAAPAPVEAATASVPAAAAAPLRARWDGVLSHLDSPRESDWKVALLEADKLADDALARAGFPGDTFGDRLTNIRPGDLASLDGLWWAHRVRNRLAHEADYFLRYTEARQAVAYFEQALTELRLI